MSERIVLLAAETDLAAKFRTSASMPRSAGAIRAAFTQHREGAIWISPQAPRMLSVLSQVSESKGHRLLLLGQTKAAEREFLQTKFEQVVGPEQGVSFLPKELLIEVMASPNRADLFIGGAVAFDSVVLWRGNLKPLVVDQTWFKKGSKSPTPDFSDLEIVDGGQTLRLGKYEAAADAVLYELDTEFRKRDRKRRLMEDGSFGGSLRRLRLQKGMPRSAFLPEISEKEIARLERGEVRNPHARTLEVLAKRLGVSIQDLRSF